MNLDIYIEMFNCKINKDIDECLFDDHKIINIDINSPEFVLYS